MKKILMLLLFIAVYSGAIKAQENTSKIDSLATELTQLKHDYNYLYCLNELGELDASLRIYAHGLDINSNSVLLNKKYDRKLYAALKNNYRSSEYLLEQLKKSVSVSKLSIAVKLNNTDFTDDEIKILKGKLEMIDACLEKAEGSLDYYKIVIDTYRDL